MAVINPSDSDTAVPYSDLQKMNVSKFKGYCSTAVMSYFCFYTNAFTSSEAEKSGPLHPSE